MDTNDELVLVCRMGNYTEWIPLSVVDASPERWAETGNDYGVRFWELYAESFR